jgi:mannose-1-phosphate guanylyltransferase
MENFYALLLAGGHGSRLWPVSQPDRPKPLLALTETRSLFEITVDRLDGLFTPEQIYVVTQQDLCGPLNQLVPAIPISNYVCEPSRRDTAPAIGLAALRIAQHNRDAVIAIMSTDHTIEQTDVLHEALQAAYSLAQQGSIVVLGVTPTHPATEYGYIEQGTMIPDTALPAYTVQRFVEKPDHATASRFLAAGSYSWDAGFVIASVKTLIAEFERLQPLMTAILKEMVCSSTLDEIKQELWRGLVSLSFDYGILEHAARRVVIPVAMGWHDIGSWEAIYEVLPRDDCDNATVGPQPPLLIETHRTLVWSQRQVVLIGVEDLVVVETSEALLICHRDHLHQIRHLNVSSVT